MVHIIEMKTYPHYDYLPDQLKHNLNLLRTNIFEGVEGSSLEDCTVDHNDLEFLSLDLLVDWIKETLPEFDSDFIEAASRIHDDCYEKEIFDLFLVDEKDLFEELLLIKDNYELRLTEDKS